MIKKLNYATNRTNHAYLYLPEAADSEYLMIWANGSSGHNALYPPIGKFLEKDILHPKLNILIPQAGWRSLEYVPVPELQHLVNMAVEVIGHPVHVGVAGYSLGSNAVQNWIDGGFKPERFSLFSNYPHKWVKAGKCPIDVPARFYYGGCESSHVQDWDAACALFADAKQKQMDGFTHGDIGDKFWVTKDGEELLKFFGEGL